MNLHLHIPQENRNFRVKNVTPLNATFVTVIFIKKIGIVWQFCAQIINVYALKIITS
jgi:hypothetical protein